MAKRYDIKVPESGEIAGNLRKEHAKRTDDVHSAMDNLRSEFDSRTDGVRDAAKNLREEYEKRVDQVHDQLDQSMDDGRKAVQEHPALVLGAALAVGVIAGILLGRKSKA